MSKLLYGVGINDADYSVTVCEKVGKKFKIVSRCNYYQTWSNMLMRSYCAKFHLRAPSYLDCKTVPEWHYFMTFRAWMEKQEWQNKHLDKDILFPGNKVYGPVTCVFVDSRVNKFILDSSAARGSCPLGVYFDKTTKSYKAQAKSLETGKYTHIGRFQTPEQAHQAWLNFKIMQAHILASEQKDVRVSEALINRYKNYGDWF